VYKERACYAPRLQPTAIGGTAFRSRRHGYTWFCQWSITQNSPIYFKWDQNGPQRFIYRHAAF